VFLGSHESWKVQVGSEVDTLLRHHAAHLASSTSLSAQLATVPLDAWEKETPILDAVIAETLRLAQPHVAMRRNLGAELHFGGNAIPTGAYVVYPFSDVHLNPLLYHNPLMFDPARIVPTEVNMAYIGWGEGETSIPCGSKLCSCSTISR
jgi:cytochrome P450